MKCSTGNLPDLNEPDCLPKVGMEDSTSEKCSRLPIMLKSQASNPVPGKAARLQVPGKISHKALLAAEPANLGAASRPHP